MKFSDTHLLRTEVELGLTNNQLEQINMNEQVNIFSPFVWSGAVRITWIAVGVLIAAIHNASLVHAEPSETKPNVIVILADDQGWGDLSVNGNSQIRTPNIDSLARDGITLDRFFVCPVCSPTRAEFLTGRHYHRTGVSGVSTGQERMRPEEKTIADAFQAAGYRTAAFGKWHNGSQWPFHPRARGFDQFYGFTSGHWGEYFDAPLERNGLPIESSGYIADAFTTEAIHFFEQSRDKPFFCYLAFNTPHSPYCAPKTDWEQFREKPITLLATEQQKEDLNVTRAVLAMNSNLDQNVGRILNALDRLQLGENTIVAYFSDNGPNSHRWNGGMKGIKGTVDEGGTRSPCFIRWPKRFVGGHQYRGICGAIDLLPTLTSLAQVKRVGDLPLDGIDISRSFSGPKTSISNRIIFSSWSGKVSARSQQFRLDPSGALFDMFNDPGQYRDVQRQYREIKNELSTAIEDWKEDMRQSDPKPNWPFSVGFADWPRTWLPARDGVAQGEIRRSAAAPNCSYFVNWSNLNDRVSWDVQVETAGTYAVSIEYTCTQSDAGSEIEVSHGNAKLRFEVNDAWDPPLIVDQDVIPRPTAESTMKKFRTLEIGQIVLERGRHPLTFRAIKIPGSRVIDLRSVTMTLMSNE